MATVPFDAYILATGYKTPGGASTQFLKADGSLDLTSYEPAFTKLTAFNKNFGSVAGTVLEGRTFGTAANSAVGDFAPFSHTHAYLPLAGGTMANTNKITNLNADLLDGLDSTAFALASHTQPLNTITGLEDALAFKAPLASPTFTGVVTLPTGTLNKIPKYTSAGVLGDSAITELADGNVGIGTTSPGLKLTIVSTGQTSAGFSSSSAGIAITSSGNPLYLVNTNQANNVWANIIYSDVIGGPGAVIQGAQITDYLNNYGAYGIWTRGASGADIRFFINADGNVSIGNTNNTHKLDVTGNIKLSGIHILGQYTTATRPAYVKGAQFFDTTINKMVIGGATAWEEVTSS